MPVNLYYTQRIRRFQQESVKYNGSSVRYSLKRTMGCWHEIIFEFTSYRLYCPRCEIRANESLQKWMLNRNS